MSSAKDGQEYLVITWKPLVRRIIPQSELEARRAPDAKHFHPKSEISEADMLTICEDWEMELVDETAGWWGLESKKRTTGACLR